MESKPNPSKEKSTNLIDVTIIGNPPPQASSTVEKKSTLGPWEIRRISHDETKTRRPLLNNSDLKHTTTDSSLGILDNISSLLGDSGVMEERRTSSFSSKIDTERELARKLLQRCSEPRQSSIFSDRDKENDGNSQNLTTDYTPSTLIDSGRQSLANRSRTLQDQESQVIFKPNEISARSSVLNSSSNKSFGSSASPPRKGGISFDTTAAAELIAQFGDEDFQSGSRVGSRMLADELSWNQNCSYAMPINVPSSGEKERLDLSCFSGIIGEFDLSSESTAGRKVSVGEFFQRKCGNIGHLQETDSISRPSFGVTITSPTKHEGNTPLIDETSTDNKEPGIAEGYREATGSVNDTKQHSLMSLSCIAQVLNDVENGTPRRLVDELIQARRNKKLTQSQLAKTNVSSYTYPVENSSFDSSSFRINETPERDTTTNRPISLLESARFSLDTKIASDASRSKLKPTRMSLNLLSEMGASHNASGTYAADCLKTHVDESYKTDRVGAVKPFAQLKKIKKSSSYHSNVTRNLLTCLDDSDLTCDPDPNLPNVKMARDLSENDLCREHKPLHIPQALPSSLPHSETFHKLESVPVQSPAAYLKDIMYEKETIVLPGQCATLKQSPKETVSNRPEDVWTSDAEISSVKRDRKLESSMNSTNGGSVDQPKAISSDGNSVSARNTSELFSCIVGVSREAEIEISNKSDRWMTCSLMLHQIQASEEYITFNLPGDTLLVEPGRGKLVKVGVNVRQMRQPILAVIHIAVSDMVTRSSKVIKHVMCFVPEEPQIGLTTSLRRDNTDFQIVPERCGKAFPVTLENKNNTELPVKIMVSKHPEEPQAFGITGFANEHINVVNQGDNDIDYNLRLKPHEKFTIKIHFVGTSLAALNIRKGVNISKLVIQLCTDGTEGLVLKEISLGVGDCSHLCDQVPANNAQRCTTPQSRQMSSPDSPHSPASNRSGHSGRHSPGSAASTSTVSGDVIPIQSTHAALVWSSLKTGRSDTKVFTILNKSENKIKLQVNIVDNNKSFKFWKDRNATGSMLLVLQRMGSKEISVMFSPNNPGACAGKIIFTHYNNLKNQVESTQRKTIFLYGYGGIGKVEISQAFKDTGGLMWLSLGHMNPEGRLSAKIKLQNTGDLCSYAVAKLTPKALYPAMISSWHVNPAELLLGPGETQWIKLEFHPRREDLALLRRAHVSHVGTISITHGDEPTRWRIRRLYNKLKESGKLRGAENDTFRNIVFPLCKAFPGEALIQDLGIIKDSVQHLGDLCRGVSQHQVMLTMEVNADETMTMLNDNADDTQVFHSVCSDNSSILTSGCDSYMPSDTLTDGNEREVSESDFTVTPRAVGLAPPFRTEATITVTSLCNVAQPFETILSHRDCLSVVPTEGMIPAGRSFPLKVQCHKEINRSLSAVLQIFVENQKREVSITVSKK